MASRPTYSIYLHHTLLSSNEERCDKAISNVQLAMRMASEDVNACEISRAWRVVIYQDVHISYGDPNPHYTFFGFSCVNGDRSPEELHRERWFVHAYVDENQNVVGVHYGKSTKRRRRNLGTLEMREVSGPFDI
ncbi:hypothetical protein HYPSUDRAFT_209701 [Hypholoma sublateritium FD-334 SS-4]|uniref:Uncharacterized protein n=1 Tax=Hypholoma sublateritium (strain FD-334 SS-4) TaxID=945553 RepID=A0A0D2LR17_HYPSF|nr:hypothetical protein HYPSUDRAFT_209701 [Hypholoma sublateritium FD-334 SS-4]